MDALEKDNPLLPTDSASLVVVLRLKATSLRNRIRQDLVDSPLRLFSVAAFILFIWAALYVLFFEVFRFIQFRSLESIVAIPYVFHFFFIALMAMLAFSTGILCFGGLYTGGEPQFLMTVPLRPWHVVVTKYVESLVLSSWSLLLLGLPLMMAMARVTQEPWYFYPLFIGLFLSFVAIPGAVGLTAAHAASLYFPRSAKRMMILATLVVLVVGARFAIRLYTDTNADSTKWLKTFFSQLSAIRGPFWPSTWVTDGIVAASRGKPVEAFFYLLVTFANGLFLSWLAVVIASRKLSEAYTRAQSRSSRVFRAGGWVTAALTWALFFYLPRRLRWLVLKDVRGLLRDPLQWSQLAILFGLLALYVVNIPRLTLDISSKQWQLLVAFLNLTAISLILATFTGRFVFPMVSLEGRHLWLVGPMPVSREQLLLCKFIFALTTTLLCAVSVTVLSMTMLQLERIWWPLHLTAVVSVCVGLCGLAVGLGARLPMFGQTDGARIASGMGAR
jgi:ABC-2 type transport system permease protein